jgi:hypothetical protein
MVAIVQGAKIVDSELGLPQGPIAAADPSYSLV